MARPETLVPGNCYFSLHYYDNDLILPMIETLVYVGQEDDPEHGRVWLFQEPGSLESPESPNTAPSPDPEETASEPPVVLGVSDDQLHEILDFDALIQRLREVAIDHPLKPMPQAAAEPATAEDFDSLSGEVARFLNSPEDIGLTITIRFTDHGLSLSRRDDGYEMHFFAHPRRDPDQESRILSVFASIGVQPRDSYLCDRGRTRVLGFPIPSDCDTIAGLCRRVLTEVHSMRRGDLLHYRPLRRADFSS
jgi:hypothetical protein